MVLRHAFRRKCLFSRKKIFFCKFVLYLGLYVSLYVCFSICRLSVCPSVGRSVRPSLCLRACLSLCLSICLCDCLSVFTSVYLSVCLSVSLSVCLSVCLSLSVCLFVRPSVYLAIHQVRPSGLLFCWVNWNTCSIVIISTCKKTSGKRREKCCMAEVNTRLIEPLARRLCG